MADEAICLIAALVAMATVAFMAYLPFSGGRPPMFRDWRDIYDAWDSARTLLKKIIFAFLLGRHLKGPLVLLTVLPFAGFVVSAATAVCGVGPEELTIIRGMLNDGLDFIREMRAEPSSAGGAGPADPAPAHHMHSPGNRNRAE